MEILNIIIIGLISLLILVFLFKAPCKENFSDEQSSTFGDTLNGTTNEQTTFRDTDIQVNENKIKEQSQTSETYQLHGYRNYFETEIPESGRDIDKLYKGYEGPKVGESEWKNVTLNQCKFHCDKMSKCIGFVRPAKFASKDRNGTCSPRTSISQCYTPLKGTRKQRSDAQKLYTYLKKRVPNQLNKCIGSAITLDRVISLQSYGDPTLYITVSNNEIIAQRKEIRPMGHTDFFENARFMIVPGRAGVGTVSFEIVQNNDNSRTKYIGHQYPKSHSLAVVSITDNSTPSDFERVSFRMVNGLADDHLLSFKLVGTNIDNNNLYVRISGFDGFNRVHIYEKDPSDNANYDNEATFDIVDPVTNESFVEGCCYDNRRDIKQNNRKRMEKFRQVNNQSQNSNQSQNNNQSQNSNQLQNSNQPQNSDQLQQQINQQELSEYVFRAQRHNIGIEKAVNLSKSQNREKEREIYSMVNSLQNKITNVDNLIKKLSFQSNSKDFFFLKSLEDKVLGKSSY